MKLKKTALLGLCLALLLAACGGVADSPAKQKPYTIGVVLKSIEHQHWLDVRSGVQDAARALGAQVVVLYPQDESAVEEQQAIFRDLLENKPDLILFAPCDSRKAAGLVEEARQQGVPVLAIDTRTEDVQLPYIGADNSFMGVLAAQRLAQLMDGAGQVAVISGVKEQASHQDRLAGFRRALEEYPQMEVVELLYANSDFSQAMACTDAIMREHPEVKGIFCTSAVMGLGAVEQKKIQFYPTDPYLVAVDTQDDALSALEYGSLHGLVSQDGYEVGYKAMRAAMQVLAGQDIPPETYINTTLLTRENVREFIETRRQAQGEQYD